MVDNKIIIYKGFGNPEEMVSYDSYFSVKLNKDVTLRMRVVDGMLEINKSAFDSSVITIEPVVENVVRIK